MANLYSGIIKSNGRYLDLSAETGITFEVGKNYQIQFSNKGFIFKIIMLFLLSNN